MTLSSLRFGVYLAYNFPEVSLVYYSEWQDIRALMRRVITEVIVIALELSSDPKGLSEKTFILRP
jgi:hypothetical protein